MQDKELYGRILGVEEPWEVERVELRLAQGEVVVHVACTADELCCPECGARAARYDRRERRWRHLDTCQLRTILSARVPRVRCSEHGVRQVRVPWSEPGSRFTAMFEALAIDWLREASLKAVAERLSLTWDEADGIMQRAVRRGLERRQAAAPRRLGVDETSYRKRHEYMTIVNDMQTGHVVHVAEGRDEQALASYFRQLGPARREQVEVIAMDMWKPYIKATREHVPGAERKIAFDRFHVASHLNKAVDLVRRREHRALLAEGHRDLARTKYLWLKNPERMDRELWRAFERLRSSSLKTARAWSIKEFAATLWSYSTRGWARRAWRRWLAWAQRSRLEPIRRAARTVREHLWGILNAIVLGTTNARAESLNARIR